MDGRRNGVSMKPYALFDLLCYLAITGPLWFAATLAWVQETRIERLKRRYAWRMK